LAERTYVKKLNYLNGLGPSSRRSLQPLDDAEVALAGVGLNTLSVA
jgi:hypothetical protein